MSKKLFVNKEEILIQDILFKKTDICFKHIDFDLFVKYASSHLLLPTIYVNLKQKKLLECIPKELKIFLKKIYEINKNRNIKLKKEVMEISRFLKMHKINHVFIKGASYIFRRNLYDIGERMIGDIDVLVDINHYEDCIKSLKKFGYKKDNKIDDSLHIAYKHYPRMTKKKRLFALEIHSNYLRKNFKNILSSREIIKNFEFGYENIKIPNLENKLHIAIYNYQINDFGFVKSTFSYKIIFDFYKILDFSGYKEDKISKNKFTRKFLDIFQLLNTSYTKKKNKPNRFILKRKSSTYDFLDTKFSEFVLIPLFKIDFQRLLIDRIYREYIYKRIKSFF